MVKDPPRIVRGLRTFAYIWLLGLLPVVLLKDAPPASAAVAYGHTWRLFQSGYLALSQQEARSGFLQYRISDPALAAKFQLLEGNSMLFRGMYEESLGLLSTYHDDGATDGIVEKLSIEAVALTRQQRIPEADSRLARAEDICKSSDFPACGDALAARAIFVAKQGQPDQARKLFLQALSFARVHRNQWLQTNTYLNLGYIALQVDHLDEAVDWSRSAYQAAASSGFQNTAQGAAGNLGWAYFELGDDERALDQFLSAEKMAEQLGNIRYELKWFSTAGYTYRDSGDLGRAAQSYRRAFDLARQINSREDIVNALEDLADISVTTGDLDAAGAYVRQVTRMESSGTIHPSPNLELTMGKVAAARSQSAQAEAYFRSVQSDPSSLVTTKLNAGFELALLYESQGNTAAAERMYRATLSTYEAARTQLKSEESQLPFGTNAAQIYDRYVRLLVRSGKSEAALAVADQSRAQTLERNLEKHATSKREGKPFLNPQQISRKTNSTLLFFWLGEQESYLWVITHAKTQLFILPAEQEIASRVERYRNALLDLRDPLEDGNSDGQSLYKMLMAPAAALIRPGESVIVLADGILSQLNFETLLVPGASSDAKLNAGSTSTMHYLLNDLVLSSAPSLAMLAAAEPTGDGEERILLLGDPISPDQDFPSLPMFKVEISRIEGHFAPAEISALAGQQATPGAYLASDMMSYTYIHFVSHAVASRVNPLDSAIILSNPAGREDSFKLYAREIIEHPIRAKLVTISACYGSGTRAYAGEGLVGLSWAFLRAGAQRVIGALWEVSDDSTARLMDSLYQGLTAGDSPAVALRSAKLALLHSQSRYRAPFYWGAFQIYSRR